jgi:hypothetical protein
MAADEEQPHDLTPLLAATRKPSINSVILAHLYKNESLVAEAAVGERLPYNDYTTIDWLHELVRR